jgi:hypothetical protein
LAKQASDEAAREIKLARRAIQSYVFQNVDGVLDSHFNGYAAKCAENVTSKSTRSAKCCPGEDFRVMRAPEARRALFRGIGDIICPWAPQVASCFRKAL